MPHFNLNWLIVGLGIATAAAVIFAVAQIFFGPRVLSLLVFRYLLKRRLAWISLLAVMLCTMMVLVVISVMSGWVENFREINHSLVGDLTIYRNSMTGFDHYQEMLGDIRATPGVRAAAPLIQTYGLININDNIRTGVQVIGIDPKEFERVNGFDASLHLQPDELNKMAKESDDKAEEAAAKIAQLKKSHEDASGIEVAVRTQEMNDDRADAAALRRKAGDFPSFQLPLSSETYRQSTSRRMGKIDPANFPGMIVGSGVVGIRRNENGPAPRDPLMYRVLAKLTPLSVNEDVSLSADNIAPRQYWIVDDSHTGVYQIDETTVYVPFSVLQSDLKMGAMPYTDAVTGNPGVTSPRCNQIEISITDPSTLSAMKLKIEAIVERASKKYGLAYTFDPIKTQTWEEKQHDFLSAVENEEGLLVILFGIISVVAVFLVFCIFYMIVAEKTRDIGVIKSVGVTNGNVAGIFLGYGLTIGILGGGLGLLGGWLVVVNINWLHGELSKITGHPIWNAKTYLFDTIPSKLDPQNAIVIVSIAILASVIGAVVPAIRAARLNPIEALRFE